ncbi:MAG: hypothetical protein ABIR96_05170 [Bdellovibrionota bacterium]
MKSFGIKIASVVFALSMVPSLSAASEAFHPRPHPGREPRWECSSENLRGQRFYSVDRFRNWAERRAQDQCLAYSRACRPVGCWIY